MNALNGLEQMAVEAGLVLGEPRWQLGGQVFDLLAGGDVLTTGDAQHLRWFLDGYIQGHKAGRIAEMRRSREAKRR